MKKPSTAVTAIPESEFAKANRILADYFEGKRTKKEARTSLRLFINFILQRTPDIQGNARPD